MQPACPTAPALCLYSPHGRRTPPRLSPTLPHVAETIQWGANLVFWTCDKSIGGKMFALIDLDEAANLASGKPHPVLSFAAGSERYCDLLEIEGLIPAPYLARAYWVAVLHWEVFTTAEWQHEIRASYDLTFARLPKKVLSTLTETPKGTRRGQLRRDKIPVRTQATESKKRSQH